MLYKNNRGRLGGGNDTPVQNRIQLEKMIHRGGSDKEILCGSLGGVIQDLIEMTITRGMHPPMCNAQRII